MLREILLTIDIIGLGMLLGGGVYESVVINPNYRVNIPESLNTLRQFMKVTTPANYFRILSPVTMVGLLVTVFIYWYSIQVRWLFVAAFVLLIIADTITYWFHYPRNKILFINTLSPDTNMLRRIAREWQIGNLFRILLMLISIVMVMLGIFSTLQIAVA